MERERERATDRQRDRETHVCTHARTHARTHAHRHTHSASKERAASETVKPPTQTVQDHDNTQAGKTGGSSHHPVLAS